MGGGGGGKLTSFFFFFFWGGGGVGTFGGKLSPCIKPLSRLFLFACRLVGRVWAASGKLSPSIFQVCLNIPRYVNRKFMVCTAHRLQCKTPHFPKHKFPTHATQINVQMQLKSAVNSYHCGSSTTAQQ